MMFLVIYMQITTGEVSFFTHAQKKKYRCFMMSTSLKRMEVIHKINGHALSFV